MDGIKIHARFRERKLGTFELIQLESMVAAGKFGPAHRFSWDQTQWYRIDQLDLLKDQLRTEAGLTSASPHSDPAAPDPYWFAGDWYVAIGQQSAGPFDFDGLYSYLINQKNRGDALYWKPGLSNWAPVRDIAEQLRTWARTQGRDINNVAEMATSPESIEDASDQANQLLPLLPGFLGLVTTSAVSAFIGLALTVYGSYQAIAPTGEPAVVPTDRLAWGTVAAVGTILIVLHLALPWCAICRRSLDRMPSDSNLNRFLLAIRRHHQIQAFASASVIAGCLLGALLYLVWNIVGSWD